MVCCFFVWLFGRENDSYCRLYIYEFVNSQNGIVGILCGNAWFYLLRMRIKAQVNSYMLALLYRQLGGVLYDSTLVSPCFAT